eukprot:g25941.t1
MLCILLWCLYLCNELRAVFFSLEAVSFLPRGSRTILKQGRFIQMSYPRWLAYCLMRLARLSIAVALLYAGVLWLAGTTSITDLILNAVALSATLQVDEMIFAALMPKKIQINIQEMGFGGPRDQSCPHWERTAACVPAPSAAYGAVLRGNARSQFESVVLLLLITGLMLCPYFSLVAPLAQDMLEVKRHPDAAYAITALLVAVILLSGLLGLVIRCQLERTPSQLLTERFDVQRLVEELPLGHADGAYCAGNQDFVVGGNNMQKITVGFKTKPFNISEENSLSQFAVEDWIWRQDETVSNYILFKKEPSSSRELGEFDQQLSMPLSTLASFENTCEDWDATFLKGGTTESWQDVRGVTRRALTVTIVVFICIIVVACIIAIVAVTRYQSGIPCAPTPRNIREPREFHTDQNVLRLVEELPFGQGDGASTCAICLDQLERHEQYRTHWFSTAFSLNMDLDSNCSEMRQHCDREDAGLLRYTCGHTCGCAYPYGNPWFRVTDSGCSDACKDAAEDYAATQICEEPPPPPRSSASSGPGADRLSAALSGRTGVERGAGRASAGQRVMACDPFLQSAFCEGSYVYRPLALLCPVSCGCTVSDPMPSYCPRSCKGCADGEDRRAPAWVDEADSGQVTNCAQAAAVGLCEAYPAEALQLCAETCDLCHLLPGGARRLDSSRIAAVLQELDARARHGGSGFLGTWTTEVKL